MARSAESPRLAVVGHPNKGKSSLVATLAQDDSVAVDPRPGTTVRARDFPMRVDGRTLYVLIDTPGFQRARAVREWLEMRSRECGATAADRPRIVAEFVDAPDHRTRFPDECEILAPIVAGAGILYVVDGGLPYGSEYEAEMEILRWTGRPSMAVINPIANAHHVDEWKAALGQFFRVVRVVDALTADFETRRQLLLAFGELEADWREPIREAVEALETDRSARRRSAAREMAELMDRALALRVERRLGPDEDPRACAAELEHEYQAKLVRLEADHRRRVQRLYDHHVLEAHSGELALLEGDLFSEGTWLAFGLRRRDLVAAGATGGAASGGVLDVALGGSSFLLGAAAGAVVGGVLGWLGAGRLAELRIVDRPLGGRLARYGPSKNVNFAYVLLGRARFHWLLIARRTHAMRSELELLGEPAARLPLDTEDRRALERVFASLRKAGQAEHLRAAAVDSLTRVLEEILTQDEERSTDAGDAHRAGS